eukprot:9483558-Pyramimonas_sp.AAC.1
MVAMAQEGGEEAPHASSLHSLPLFPPPPLSFPSSSPMKTCVCTASLLCLGRLDLRPFGLLRAGRALDFPLIPALCSWPSLPAGGQQEGVRAVRGELEGVGGRSPEPREGIQNGPGTIGAGREAGEGASEGGVREEREARPGQNEEFGEGLGLEAEQ